VRIVILVLMHGVSLLATLACSSPLTGPTSEIGTRNQLVSSLRAKSLNVSISGETSPSANGYFSVASTDLKVENDLLKVFEYGTAGEMEVDARLISSEGQPNPKAAIGWISKPHFYEHGQIIVLYIGCNNEIVLTLDELLGPPIARGPGCTNP
jgi:hypothetical protein